MIEQVLQIGGANVQEVVAERSGHVGQEAHGEMPLQGSGYGVKKPPQGLLAATVLVEQIRPPDGLAEALLEVGKAGRIADCALVGGRRASVWVMRWWR